MKISKVYKLASNPGTIFMLVCAILSLTFTTPSFAVTSNNSNSIDLGRYSGDELFKAIFTLEGDLVNQIPTLANLRTNLGGDSNGEAAAAIYAEMKKSHPRYFSELEEAVASRNHYQIERTLEKGAQLVILTQYSKFVLKTGDPSLAGIAQYDLNNTEEREAALEIVNRYMAVNHDVDIQAFAWFAFAFAVAVAVAWVAVAVAVVGIELAEDKVVAEIIQDGNIVKEKIINELVRL